MSKIKLSKEQRDALEEAGEALEEAEDGIARLKVIGVDVTELEDKLGTSRRLRKGLLDQF